MENGAYSLVKITNPLYMGSLGDRVKEYVDKTKPFNITYESMWTYLCSVIQIGGNMAEVYVVYRDNEPVAFAQWHIAPLPSIGTAHIAHIYSWAKDKKVPELLGEKFEEFAARNNCPLYTGNARNEAVFKRTVEGFRKKGVAIEDSGFVLFAGRRK